MPAPFEMVSGPLEIYTAPEATLAPLIHLPPPSPWTLLGTNGARSMSDDGVQVGFEETVESQRSLGSTAVQKQFRTEEDMMLSFNLLDVSAETFALAMSGLPVTEVAAGTEPSPFSATPVPVVSGGTGTGAAVASIVVDDNGVITFVAWSSGGSAFVAGDTITFTQTSVTGTYTLVAADVVAGVIQTLVNKSIAGAEVSAGAPGYRYVPMIRRFNILNLAFLARGFSPYADNQNAQYWLPKGYASFSGEMSYVKGEAAMIEIEVMAIEHYEPSPTLPSYGYGQYQTQDALP